LRTSHGDAHLKSFGVIYEEVTAPARLAPLYDLVSTVRHLPKTVNRWGYVQSAVDYSLVGGVSRLVWS
jgi:hypothetical protein